MFFPIAPEKLQNVADVHNKFLIKKGPHLKTSIKVKPSQLVIATLVFLHGLIKGAHVVLIHIIKNKVNIFPTKASCSIFPFNENAKR